jgi:hypothetical protein
MPDPAALDHVLRLVAEGRLTAAEAGPILDALDASSEPGPGTATEPDDDGQPLGPASALRIRVLEAGRTVVNLRIPIALGRAAINQVPGISAATSDRIREAIAAGVTGPIVEVDDGDDGVRISLE